jgi:hypothetical protein
LSSDSIYAHSKSKSTVYIRVNSTHFKDFWMYHSRPEKFYPSASRTHPTISSFSLTNLTTDIDFSTWFCKRKYTRTKTGKRLFSEKLFHGSIESPLKISKSYSFPDYKSFKLVKITRMASIFLFITIDSSCCYYFDRELSLEHRSYLYRRRMSSEEILIS